MNSWTEGKKYEESGGMTKWMNKFKKEQLKKKLGQRRNKEKGRRKEEKMRQMNKKHKEWEWRNKKIKKSVGMTKWMNKYRKKMIEEKAGQKKK